MTKLIDKNSLPEDSELRLVALQLQKDFMMFGVDFGVDEVINFKELKRILEEENFRLLRLERSKLTQLIYRIDIPESSISTALNSTDLREISASLSLLMIERTQLKIRIRKQHDSR